MRMTCDLHTDHGISETGNFTRGTWVYRDYTTKIFGFTFVLRPTLLFIFNLFNHVDLIFLSSLNPIQKVQMSVILEIAVFKMYLFLRYQVRL